MKTYAHVVDGIVVEPPIELADGLVLGEDIFTPAFAAALHACPEGVETGWVFDGATFASPPPPPPPTPADLRAYAASARYARETGGITVGGVKVATDESSQAKITGAYVKASRDASFKTPWKGSDGTFTVLDAPTLLALGDAVTAHVAACFGAEAQINADITAVKVTTAAQVDAAFAAVAT